MQKSPSNIDQGRFRKSIDLFKPNFFCKYRNPHTKWLATTLSFIKPPTRMGSVNLELNLVETSLVYRRHDQFYYLDLYDNKVGKTRFNGICLGLDELDFLISLRSNLDSLQSCFPPMVSIFNCNLENQQCECIIMLSHFHLHISFFTTINISHIE